MRSDFKHVLQLFAKLSYENPKHAKIPTKVFEKTCMETLVNDYEDTLEAMRTDELLDVDPSYDPEIDDLEGYYLTKKGYKALRETYWLVPEQDTGSLEAAINEVTAILNIFKIDSEIKDAYLDTLQEIRKCFKQKCLNASIALSGKLLEIYITSLLENNNIKVEKTDYNRNGIPIRTRTELSLGELIGLTAGLNEKVKQVAIDDELIGFIKAYRNKSIHFSKGGDPKLTMDKVEKYIYLTLNIIKYSLN